MTQGLLLRSDIEESGGWDDTKGVVYGTEVGPEMRDVIKIEASDTRKHWELHDGSTRCTANNVKEPRLTESFLLVHLMPKEGNLYIPFSSTHK